MMIFFYCSIWGIMGKVCSIRMPNPTLYSSYLGDTINPLQLFIFDNVMRCSRLQLWVGYFIYLKFTRFSSIVYLYGLSIAILCSIKETHWSINIGMCVLLFDVFKHLL